MLVMKFGGTSVKDADAIRRLTTIVGRARTAGTRTHAAVRGPLVVVSALSKVTDALLALSVRAASVAVSSGEVSSGGVSSGGVSSGGVSPGGVASSGAATAPEGRAEMAAAIEALRARHHEVAGGVVRDATKLAALTRAIDADLNELATLLHALSVVHDASPRLQDAIAAIGELLSSRIVAAALEQTGLPATWVDARAVLVTDAEIPAAPLMEETRAQCREVLLPLIARGRVPVLGGFIGATGASSSGGAGVTTTLGRGGSDYSASVFGVGVGADEIQIWTDVDGMLTADPRVIHGARPLPRLSFAEASELAYFGAKVLHPSTITPAVAEEIPVRILNSQRPEVAGTLITREGAHDIPALTAIACKRDVTVIDIVSTRMLMAHGFLRRLFEVFERHRTAVDVVTTSEVSVSVTIDDVRRLDDIVRDLSAFADVSVTGEMALVCAVGERLRTDPSLSARLVGALDGFPLRMVSQAGSRRNVTFVLPQADLVDAMQLLHERFCIGEPRTTPAAITSSADPGSADPGSVDAGSADAGPVDRTLADTALAHTERG